MTSTRGRGLLAVHAAAMIATPLRPRGRRAGLASVVVGTLAASTHRAAARHWGPQRASLAAVAVTTLAGTAELVGARTGRPFGRYEYTGALRPTIGGVPAVVPAAWFAMAVPAREVAHGALGPRSARRARIVLGALCLTAWDLFLDPQMVGEGYWRWQRGGRYREVPVSNFAGWLLTSAALMSVLDALLPPGEPDVVLVGEYAWIGAMQTLGFARFFDRNVVTAGGVAPARPGNAVVAAAGGAAMLPPVALALRRALAARRPRGGPDG